MAENVGGIEYYIDADSSQVLGAEKTVDKSTAKMQQDFARVDGAIKKNDSSLKTFSKSTSNASNQTSGFGRKAGAASIQVQQLTGQIQGGVNPLIAFSQQVADLGIVLGLPLLGSIVGIGAALAINLVPNMAGAKTGAEELTEAIDALKKIASKNTDGLYEFSDAIAEMSDVGKSTLLAGLELGLIQAEKATAASTEAIIENLSKLDVERGFSKLQGDIESLVNTMSKANDSVIGFTGFEEIAKELGEELGLVGDDAEKAGERILKTLAELKKKPSVEGLTALQKELTELTTSGGKVSSSVKEIVGNLAEFFAQARSAGEQAKFIQEQIQKLNDSGKVELKVDTVQLTEAEKALISLQQELAISTTRINDGEGAARRLAIAFAIGKDNAAGIPIEIQNTLTALEAVEAQEKANHETKVMRSKEMRETEIANKKMVADFDRVNNELQQGGISELDKIQADFEAKRELILEHEAMLLGDKTLSNQQLLDVESKHTDALLALDADAAKKRQKLADIEKQGKLNAVSSTFSALSSLMNTESKKLFEIGKAAAIAGAIVDGYAAVSKTMASVPYPFNIPLAAAQAVASAVQVQNIAKQKVGGAQSMNSATSFSGGQPAVNTQSGGDRNITVSGIDANSLVTGGQLIETLNAALGDGYTINLGG